DFHVTGVQTCALPISAPPLLLEPVGLGSGEGLHERGLAVVDVSGGGDHVHARTASTIASSSAGSTASRSSSSRPSRTWPTTGRGIGRAACREAAESWA